MDYKQEFNGLNKASAVYKPVLGVHKIVLLEEPQPCEYISNDGKVTPQIVILVELNNERKSWYITKGTTTKSLYGQLMALGNHKGKLEGELITLSVTTTKNSKGENVNSYTIIESVEAMAEMNKEQVVH